MTALDSPGAVTLGEVVAEEVGRPAVPPSAKRAPVSAHPDGPGQQDRVSRPEHKRESLRRTMFRRALVVLSPLAILCTGGVLLLGTTSQAALRSAAVREAVEAPNPVVAQLGALEGRLARSTGGSLRSAPSAPSVLAAGQRITTDMSTLVRHQGAGQKGLARAAQKTWLASWAPVRQTLAGGRALAPAARAAALAGFAKSNSQLATLSEADMANVAAYVNSVKDTQHLREVALVGITLAGLLLGLVTAARTYGDLNSELTALESAAARYGAGELDTDLQFMRNDELGRVADAMRSMALQLREKRDVLALQALHDGLTGLANRALFSDRLEGAVARSRRGGGPVSVFFIDLDMFKTVNDTRGHEAGDILLKAVASHLSECVREVDTLARFGGDEFAVLLDGADEATALEVADRVHQAVPLAAECLGGLDVVVSASIGVVVTVDGRETVADLMRFADVAMYAAKSRGSGRTEVFVPEMEEKISAQVTLRTELRAALEHDELELHYQPVIEAETGRTVAVEALLRWRHPSKGMLPAKAFLEEAERSGLILPIGGWALRNACRQAAAWHAQGGLAALPIHVNVSMKQLAAEGFAETVASALGSSGLEPGLLTLDIGEGVLSDIEVARQRLGQLRGLGVRLALDDFGTGGSSLSHLKDFPVDDLKIDRSLVGGVTTSTEDAAMVTTVAELGRLLKLRVIAEGVECPIQAETLTKLGCTHAQGFHYAHPMPPSALLAWLKAGATPGSLVLNIPAAD